MRVLALALALLTAGAALAQEDEPPRTLAPGKGVEVTAARCVICHDAQHITRTKLSRGEWEFNIKNMIERGAPIAADEIAPILEYLATYYNRDKAPPAPAAQPADATVGTDSVANLLTTNACIACHQTDKRVIGPSFREIAAKYAADGGAAARLAAKIRQGGSGAWGTTPMPPNSALSDADLTRLVQWVLGLR